MIDYLITNIHRFCCISLITTISTLWW